MPRSDGPKHWKVPVIWPNSTVVVIGGGPSLRGFDFSPIHDQHVLGCNQAFELGPWVDAVWFGDCRWYDWNKTALHQFGGLKVTCCPKLAQNPVIGIKAVQRSRKSTGIDPNRDKISWNRHTGGSALNLAVHFGARRILLLGYDMKLGKDGSHWWHTKHKSQPRDNIYKTRFLPAYTTMATDLERLRVEVINAGPDSDMEVFPRMTLAEALQRPLRDPTPHVELGNREPAALQEAL
jgi:hypothetical protein